MKVLRSTLVAATVFVVAACGDKVVVDGPSTSDTAARVNSVTVSPSNVTMNVNQTVTFSAIVDVSNGAAQTVTWSSASSSVTVSAAGVATAVSATPGVAVCATSTVDATKKGCASVVVGTTTVIPATVSIQSITISGTAGTSVIPGAVAGGIDVRVNVSPGTAQVTKVVLLVGTIRADSQMFTAAQSAALRFAAEESMANQSAFPPITFAVNTAAIVSTTTGAVRFPNATYTISVQLYTTASATVPAATATAATPLTFVNVDGWLATTSGSTNNALNAGGFRYDRGPLTVSVVPVSYSGGVMASGTTTFGGACDGGGGNGGTFLGGARTATLVAPAAGAFAWTATFSNTAAAAVSNVTNYEFTAGLCGLNAIGETPTVTAVNANGDALFAAAAPINGSALTGLRLDNRAPRNPAAGTNPGTGLIRINVNPNLRASGWINDAVVFNAGARSATSNNYLCDEGNDGTPTAFGTCIVTDMLPVDAGQGTTTFYVKAAATKTLATTAAGLTGPSSLAPTVTNAGYCAIAYAADGLGNETASPSTATACAAEINSTLIGVDRAAPTLAYCQSTGATPCAGVSLAANGRLSGGALGGDYRVAVNDTGLVGNSGMLPGTPVGMRIEVRRAGAVPNSAGTTTIYTGLGPTGAATTIAAGTFSGTGVTNPAAGEYMSSITTATGGANHGYYTHFARAFDAAGNSADVGPRVIVYDAAPPLAGTPSAPVTITATNFSASGFISEDLDIQDYSFGANYGANAGFSPAVTILQMPMVPVNGYNAAIFSNTNFGVTTTVPLPLALQANMAAGLTTFQANGLLLLARAQSNLPGASAANFIPGAVTPGAAIPTTNMTSFPAVTLPAGVTGTVTGNATAATAAQPASVLLTATLTGTTAIFNNPFSRMDFYMLDAPGARYFLVGTALVATLNDNGATRTFTFTTTINGATVYALLGGAGATWASNIVAVGVGAANGNVAMVAAANTALNVVF